LLTGSKITHTDDDICSPHDGSIDDRSDQTPEELARPGIEEKKGDNKGKQGDQIPFLFEDWFSVVHIINTYRFHLFLLKKKLLVKTWMNR